MFFLDTELDHSFLCLVVVIVFETWCRTCFINIISFGCLYDCLFFFSLFVCLLPAAGLVHSCRSCQRQGSRRRFCSQRLQASGSSASCRAATGAIIFRKETRTQNGLYM